MVCENHHAGLKKGVNQLRKGNGRSLWRIRRQWLQAKIVDPNWFVSLTYFSFLKVTLKSNFFLTFIYFYWKGRYTERRRVREEDLPSDDPCPKQPQWMKLSQSEARSLLWGSHMGAGSQGFGPSSIVFPGHNQGAGWEVGLPGLEPAPIWDPGAFKARTLAVMLLHRAWN